jgi:hypothetical protein
MDYWIGELLNSPCETRERERERRGERKERERRERERPQQAKPHLLHPFPLMSPIRKDFL